MSDTIYGAAGQMAAEMAAEETAPEMTAAAPADQIGGALSGIISIFRAETGAGAIDDYVNHPLNSSGSAGVAQILRGATGLFGALNLAIIDILLGIIECLKDKGKGRTDE